MEKKINVRTFGELSFTLGETRVAERSNRSKEWILIAFLIVNRHRMLSRDELLQLLVEHEEVLDPGNTFRKILWRARKALEPLSEALGCDLILYKKSLCSWNDEIPVQVDAEEFENLCRAGVSEEDSARQVECLRKAAELYQGDFLPKMAGENWRTPLAAYYTNMLVDLALSAVPVFLEAGASEDAISLCRKAIETSPYDEQLYELEMESQLKAADYEGAAQTFRNMKELLLSELDVAPGEEAQRLYQEALRNLGVRRKSMETIRSQLREEDRPDGARICDFTTFQLFYQMEARSAERRGDAIHVGVLSLEAKKGKTVTERGLERAMKVLRESIHKTLRVGDVAACCSASQYVVLLVQANYENSQMVCRRVEHFFAATYPSAPVSVVIDVMPLEPFQTY